MLRTLPKTKIHRAAVTHGELNDKGSWGIDENLLDANGRCESEQLHRWNLYNGMRFVISPICAARGERITSVNGPAGQCASADKLVIITAFAQLDDAWIDDQPKSVLVTPDNRVGEQRQTVPVQQF